MSRGIIGRDFRKPVELLLNLKKKILRRPGMWCDAIDDRLLLHDVFHNAYDAIIHLPQGLRKQAIEIV